MHDRFIYNRKQRHSGAIQCPQDLQLNLDLQLMLEFHSLWKFSLLSTGQHALTQTRSQTEAQIQPSLVFVIDNLKLSAILSISKGLDVF